MTFNLDQLRALKNQGISEIFTYVYCVCQNDKSLQGSLIKVGALDDNSMSATEKIGDSIKIQPRTWTRLSVSLDAIISNYDAIKSGDMKFFNIYNGGDGLDNYEEEMKVYFTPILFGLPN